MAPAFVEVHFVLNNATGEGGMYLTEMPDTIDTRTSFTMQKGEEHGPFFHHANGKVTLLPNGAVSYPWHGWQSGPKQAQTAYDLVAAFEINPDYVRAGDLK